MSGCDLCDTHGPELDAPTYVALLEFHRAVHHLVRVMTAPLVRLLDLLDRKDHA